MLRFVFTICSVIFLLSGCGSVYFGNRVQYEEGPSKDAVHVYLDKRGSIYPTKSLVVNDDALDKAGGELKNYFSVQNPSCGVNGSAAVCEIADAPQEAKDSLWLREQDIWFDGVAAELKAKLASQQGPLVVLIHGFRVKNANPSYDAARVAVEGTLKSGARPTYLLVHWDGLKSFLPMGVWGRAQVNGFYVGASLRRVLRSVPVDVPVRIMAHSSGAFVSSAMVGDPSGTFETVLYSNSNAHVYSPEFLEYLRAPDASPLPPFKDLRLAVIAPATTGEAFAGLIETPDWNGTQIKPIPKGMNARAKLIVGANKWDIGLAKVIGVGSWSGLGSAALGRDVDAFCRVWKSLTRGRNGGPLPEPARIDFTRTNERSWVIWDSHDWKAYLQSPRMKDVMELLFVKRIDAGGDSVNCKNPGQ